MRWKKFLLLSAFLIPCIAILLTLWSRSGHDKVRPADADMPARQLPAGPQAPTQESENSDQSNAAAMPASRSELPGPTPVLPIISGKRTESGFEIVNWPEGTPHYEGEYVAADVTTQDGRKLRMSVNQLGEYPRVQVRAGELVQVRMQFQSSPPGMPIALTAQDGGTLAAGKPTQSVQLGEDRTASFEFTAGTNDGIHRISVTTPEGEVKNFDFWVGALNVMRTAAR